MKKRASRTAEVRDGCPPERRLCALAPGEAAVVARLLTGGAMRRRLQELGLIPGAPVACLGRSPGGDPAAYRIAGAIVAIRDEDAAGVIVRTGKEDDGWD